MTIYSTQGNRGLESVSLFENLPINYKARRLEYIERGIVTIVTATINIRNPDDTDNQHSTHHPTPLSRPQVIPSRLPDGQVVFLLPSHYVQLAAAAAANGINIGPNPPTAIWATTNMSLLKATDKLIKRPLCDDSDWPPPDIKPGKSPRLSELVSVEQPLDFTTSSAKKLKAAAARFVAQQQAEAAALLEHPPTSEPVNVKEEKQPREEKQPTTTTTAMTTTTPMKEEETRPASPTGSPGRLQPVKDEEGMWRPW